MPDETLSTPAVNTSSGSAHVIPSLPWVIDQDESEGSAELWFKYTALAGQSALGLMISSNADSTTTYEAKADIYSGAPGSPFITGQVTPGKVAHTFEIPLVEGTTYYIKITNAIVSPPSQAGVVLTVDSVLGPSTAYTPGDLLVNDDTASFYPFTVINPTDGTIKNLLQDFPASEIGAALANKGFLFYDNNTLQFSLYDADLNLITAFDDPLGTHTPSVTGDFAQRFFFAEWGGGGIVVKAVDPDTGAVSDSRTLTGFAQQRIAISPDESKMYYDQTTSGVIEIHVWDMVNDVALPTLATIDESDGADFLIDMHVMADGSIVAMNKHHAFRYDPDGTLLNTYTIPEGPHRLSLDLDPLYFWVWTEPPSTSGTFQKILASDGTVATEFTAELFESGNGGSYDNTSPAARFGPSGTCALLIALSSGISSNSPSSSPSLSASASPSGSPSISPSASPSAALIPINPWVILQFSDDGGQTWSNEYWRKVGGSGEYKTRVKWNRLGRAKDRVFRIAVSDPCKWILVQAVIDSELGTSRR